jgi:hypothetical protein
MGEVTMNGKPVTIPRQTKYRSNPNFESVRMEIIGILNSYDPSDSVVDNYARVKAEAIINIQHIIKDGQAKLENCIEKGYSASALGHESYLQGCHDCLKSIQEYL